jgi:hypothetical protein
MRCLTKNLAMFGAGINIYSGEDLPLSESDFLSEEEKAVSISHCCWLNILFLAVMHTGVCS